jgi:hypothetical protein
VLLRDLQTWERLVFPEDLYSICNESHLDGEIFGISFDKIEIKENKGRENESKKGREKERKKGKRVRK